MSWLDESAPERRPVVFVEDHLYHTTDLLSALRAARPDLISQSTVAVLDRAGPDTDASVRMCTIAFPEAAIEIPAATDLADAASFSRWVGRRIRPGGVLIQDVQLSTLPFIPADRWWESIFLASTIRGMFPERLPVVRFLSNKRGYSATFGRDMVDAGFDPRDVMEKAELTGTVVPTLCALFDRLFTMTLDASDAAGARHPWPVADSAAERQEIDQHFDLVLWHGAHRTELAGRALSAQPGRLALRPGSPEAVTWAGLITSRLARDEGLAVVSVGARVGPPQAERAELTNLAARHIHTLRSRLRDAGDVVTVHHAYRLNDRLRVGIVRPRATFTAAPSIWKVTE